MTHQHFDSITKALANCFSLNALTQSDKAQIARHAQWRTFEKNEEVFSFEHKGHYFYIVAEGTFHLRLKSKQERAFNAGDVFGEIAIFNDKTRTGAIRAVTAGTLVAISKELLLPDNKLLLNDVRCRLLFSLAQNMAQYFYDPLSLSSKELISHGESEQVEFKVSMEQEQIKEGIARTICAFSNKRGGAIFVGVHDKNKVVGLRKTGGKSVEEFRRDIGTFLKKHLHGHPHYRMDVESVDSKPVLRIDCDPSDVPIFYKAPKTHHEAFLVRNDTRNDEYEQPSEAIRYARRRFTSQV